MYARLHIKRIFFQLQLKSLQINVNGCSELQIPCDSKCMSTLCTVSSDLTRGNDVILIYLIDYMTVRELKQAISLKLE